MAYFDKEDFSFNTIEVGDRVDAATVMDLMDLLPPKTMRLSCAQLGEPYSHRIDTETGKLRPTFATFRCIDGNFTEGTWEFCGYCFARETTERGKNPVYC